MKEQDLAELLRRYREGRCTEEEITRLESWYAQWNMADPVRLSESDLNHAGELIGHNILPRRRKKVIRMWPRVAAAITVLTALSAYIYLSYNREGKRLQQEVVVNIPDVPPGGNKAVLTLSNGATIVLSDADKGVLATQGNQHVVKASGSILTYRAAGGSDIVGGKPVFNTLTVPRGGQYQLVLSDGTKVWLNAASSIIYPTDFAGGERKVVVSGEAYFEVARDEKKPFVVETRNEVITVLGTHFNVYAYMDEPVVSTTLLTGSVKISPSGSDDSQLLRPGEQMQVNKAGKVRLLRNVNTDRVVAWTKGQLSMEDVSVKSLMSRLSRWYNVDIQYEGKIPDEKFGGIISRNVYLSDMLSVLNANGIHARLEGKIIIVSSK